MVLDTDPLVLFNSTDLKKLQSALKHEFPRSILVEQWIANRINWDIQEPGEHPFSICSPEGDYKNGLVIFGRTGKKLVYYAIFKFGDDLKKLREALLRTRRIPWSEQLVYGIPRDLVSWFTEIKSSLGYKLHLDVPTKYFWLPKEAAINFTLDCPNDVYVEGLKSEDSALINSLWPHKFPGSEQYLSDLMRLNYGFGVYSKVDNELLSWGFNYEYGDIGALQTKDDHQRKGYAKLVIKAICIEKMANGEDPYAFIVDDNIISEKLFTSIGFKFIGLYNWLEFK